MATLNRTFSVKNGIDVANTIIVDSSRNLSNIATANATTVNATTFITVGGLNVTDQANAARNQANTARNTANDAYAEANIKLNIAGGTITGSLNVANITESNVFVSTSQNVVPPNLANTNGERLRLFDFDIAGRPNYAIGVEGNHIWMGVDGDANTVGFKWYGNTSQAMRLSGNGVLEVANTVVSKAFITTGGLDVTGQANDAYDQANTARDTANGAYAQANGAYGQANGAYAQANGAYSQANGAFAQANGAYSQANGAYAQANTAYGQANDAYAQANTGYAQANAARDQANTAYGQANDAYAQANTARGTANDAYGQANAAYAEANLKLNLSGGTITGDLDVTGNLYVGGNTTYINVSTYTVEDPLIYLAANNELDDMVDIGFMGGKNAAGVYAHTGLVRHAADDKWYLFDGLSEEGHQNNVIDVANTYLATLRANLEANSILLVGNTVATQANLTIANDQANAAYLQANTARGTANDAYAQANTARDTANDSYGQANTARTTANDAYAQANSARSQANAAYGDANTRVLKSGDTMTGTLTITTSGTGLSVGNAAISYELSLGSLNVTTNTVTTSATGQVVLDTFGTTEHASAKYFVQVKSGSAYHTTEVVLVQDATNVWLTEYGSIQTGASLGSFSADISSGEVRLLFNADNAVNTIRAVRYGVAPP